MKTPNKASSFGCKLFVLLLVVGYGTLSLRALPAVWNSIGDVSFDGNQFLLTTVSNIRAPDLLGLGDPISGHNALGAREIESVLEVPSDTLQKLARTLPYGSQATEGSAIAFNVNAKAGDVFSFQWNFLSNGGLGNANDFAFLTYVSATTVGSLVLGSMETLAGPSPVTLRELPGFANGPTRESGFSNFKLTFPEDGSYTVGIGVIEMLDYYTASGLQVKSVPVPDSGQTLVLLLGSATILLLCHRFAVGQYQPRKG